MERTRCLNFLYESDYAILRKSLLDLKNGRPENGFGSVAFVKLERSVREVLGFDNS
jgi:hypothetical protein